MDSFCSRKPLILEVKIVFLLIQNPFVRTPITDNRRYIHRLTVTFATFGRNSLSATSTLPLIPCLINRTGSLNRFQLVMYHFQYYRFLRKTSFQLSNIQFSSYVVHYSVFSSPHCLYNNRFQAIYMYLLKIISSWFYTISL